MLRPSSSSPACAAAAVALAVTPAPSPSPSRAAAVRDPLVTAPNPGRGEPLHHSPLPLAVGVEESGVREVLLYRPGLVTAATPFVAAASAVFMPEAMPSGRSPTYAIAPRGWACRLLLLLSPYPHLRHADQVLPPGALGGRPLDERAWCSACWSTLPRNGLSTPHSEYQWCECSADLLTFQLIHCIFWSFVSYQLSHMKPAVAMAMPMINPVC